MSLLMILKCLKCLFFISIFLTIMFALSLVFDDDQKGKNKGKNEEGLNENEFENKNKNSR